ncbi:hypothetical protein KKP90_02185, partial [Methanothermococcus sp. SCGC AD-155-E23]|nr:hypothetical protein [Methanothermococcus sp. SCGC AD-155-E23]
MRKNSLKHGVENLNKVFEMRMDEFEEEGDEVEKKLFEAWGQVERGEMDSEDVINNLDLDEEDREVFKKL